MKNIKTTKIIAFFMAVIMILPMVPVVDLTVYAVGEEYYANIRGTAVFNPTVINDPHGMVYITDTPENGLIYIKEYTLDAGELDAIKTLNMVIEDCYVGNGGYWYKVKTADGSDLPGKLADKSWIYQNEIPTVGYPDVLIVTPPPVTPETPEISATVKDANGKDVTVKVEGDLPEGATLAVSVPTVGGEALPNVFDIKVYDKNGNEWQPAIGETVCVSLPVSEDVESINIVHALEDADRIRYAVDNGIAEIASLADADAAEKETLSAAIAAYQAAYQTTDIAVAYEEFENILVVDGVASVDSCGFSCYIYWEDQYQSMIEDWESLDSIDSGRIYYVKPGESFRFGTNSENYSNLNTLWSFDENKLNMDGKWELSWSGVRYWVVFTVPADESLVGQTFTLTFNKVGEQKTTKFQIVSNETPTGSSDSDTTYIAIYTGDDMPSNLFDDISSNSNYRWYSSKGDISSAGDKTSYANSSVGIIYKNIFNQSALVETKGNTSLIFDANGIKTRDFAEINQGLSNEILGKLGYTPVEEYTFIIYGVKKVISNNKTEWYVICTAVAKDSVQIIYNTNVPNGFDDAAAMPLMPPNTVGIMGQPITIPNLPIGDKFQIQAKIENRTYTATLKGWSTDPGANPSEAITDKIAGDQWYNTGETVTLYSDLNLYAIWETTYTYESANVEIHNHVLDENDSLITNSNTNFTFQIDSSLYGSNYQIYTYLGIAKGEEGTFDENNNTFTLNGNDYIIIKNVPNLENTTDPSKYYVISELDVPGYQLQNNSGTGYTVSSENRKISFFFDKTTNVSGECLIDISHKVKVYTITFDTNGGTAIAPITQNFGTSVTAPADPTKIGYTFAGWEPAIPATMPAENMTITAKWTINQYTITFDTDGGSTIAPITQNYGTAVTAPANPTKTGYTFAGWDKAIPATMPAENITIKALWTINQYTITFNTDGGSTIAPITQNYGTAVTAPANPTKTGYTFAGWEPAIPATMPVGGVTVKAKWTINQYTITFDTDGGSTIAPITQDYGTVITAPADPTKTGYTFAGWEPAIPATMPAENITIKALWTIKQYTITYNLGLTPERLLNEDQFVNQTKTHNQAIHLHAITPTAKGATFKGWDINGDNQVDYIPDAEYTVDENLTLVAIWDPIPYKINYTVNGLNGSPVPEFTSNQGYYGDKFDIQRPAVAGYSIQSITVDGNVVSANDQIVLSNKDVEIVITYTPNTNTPYIVKIYTENVNGGYTEEITPCTGTTDTPVSVTPETKIGFEVRATSKLSGTVAGDGSLVLTVYYDRLSYTITFDTDGGSTISPITQKYGTTVIAPQNPTKPGYNFVGWSSAVPTTMPAENIFVTAAWGIIKYQITYNLDGGTVTGDNPTTYTVNDNVTLINPTKEGYMFKGWVGTDINEATQTVVISAGSTGDRSYTATWTKNSYTVTWIVDGDVITEETYEYGDTINKPLDPTKEGYTFNSWSGYVTGMTMPANNIGFEATWTENTVTINFIAKGPEGTSFGSITPTTQTVGVVTGQPSATVTVNAPTFKFVGWFTDANCQTMVPEGWVDSNFILTPGKNASGLYESATYYAKFEYNLTTLTITTTGADAIDPNQSFIFNIQGFGGVNLDVTVHGNNKVKIDGLTVGQEYTVTAKTNWSWRYDVANAAPVGSGDVIGIIESSRVGNSSSLTITLGVNGEVQFTFTRGNSQWLDGDSWCDNRFMRNVTPAIN